MSQEQENRIPWLPIIIVVVIIGAFAVILAPRIADATGGADINTAQVTTITNVITVDASGTIMPVQTAQLYWGTTGQVADVNIAIGDRVSTDDVLMTVDLSSVPANLVGAEVELTNAQEALDDLLNPDSMDIATAEQGLAAAYGGLSQAEQSLLLVVEQNRNEAPTDIYDNITEALDALEEARSAYPLATSNLEVQTLYRAMRLTDRANQVYQDVSDAYEESDNDPDLRASVDTARESYEAALDVEVALKDQVDGDDVEQVERIADAQRDLDDAIQAFIDELDGDDIYNTSITLINAKTSFVMAEEQLFAAISRIENVRFGPDDDVLRAAESRVSAAQAAVDILSLTAPFDGEIIAVNYKAGDVIVQQQPAVTIANLSDIIITAYVDETEINDIVVGDPVSIDFNAQPDLDLEGTVAAIAMTGQNIQGLVRYEVEIVLDDTSETILLGATADISIEVDIEDDVLAVPLDALQSDSQGEFVNRVTSDGNIERVSVRSSTLQGNLVVVSGNLSAGDEVELVEPEQGSLFGGS